METNKNQSSKAIALIGSIVLTLISLTSAGAAKATTSVATFNGPDTVTQGNWQGKYGADGYAVANGIQNAPAYATFAVRNQLAWTWAPSSSDPRALSSVNGPAIASTWYSASTFSFDVNMTDGNSHQLAVYAVDWDHYGRSETIQILDANSGTTLDTRSISSFTNGIYLVWTITGHVTINVTNTNATNGVASGVFFGGTTAAPTSTGTPTSTPTSTPVSTTSGAVVSFLTTDATTLGNWQGKYGANGYVVANGIQNAPAYATFALQNQSAWTWAASTSDPRALSSVNGPAIASTWYSASTFTFDVNMTDGKSHQLAIYAVDWDHYGRSETIQILDASSGASLDTRSLSSFTNGIYLVWNITGHVTINVTNAGGANAVASGVFFGGTTAASTPAATPNNGTAPVITTQPSSQTVTAGQSATFAVANTGTAPMLYQWTKNGIAVSGATSSSYTTSATSASDSGSQISVMVSNGAGAVTSNSAVLTVKAGTLVLNISASSLSFGSVNVSSSSTQNVTLTNAGTANVSITNVSISGAGFNASGVPTGTILAPGQSATLNAMFSPAASGNATGSVTVASNASAGTKVITLSGSGVAAPVAHTVALSWAPSTSTVVGYNVYVSTVSGTSYTRLTSSPVASSSYMDSGLQTAQVRYYVVTSVDSNNMESAYSTQVSAIVP